MIILSIVVTLLFLIIASIYNGLIRRKNEVDNAFSGVDVQLKKRYDLIPNLVETVKQYAAHEKELLTKVTDLRTKALSGGLSENEKITLDNELNSAIGGIMVAVENYPDLKANENFLNLQRNLTEVESQIAAARRTYNAVVTAYNNGIEIFPNNLLAGRMNMYKKEVLEIPAVEREPVKVKELF